MRSFENALGVEGTPAAGGNANVQSHTHAAHTAADVDRLWVLVSAKATAAAGSSALNTPSGFVETADLCSAHGTNPNGNLGMHHKAVGAGGTGVQAVDSNDAVNRTWAGVGFLLQPRLMRLAAR